MEQKRRDWVKLLTLALCVALLGLNLWQLRRISDLRNRLGSVETNLQMETRRLDERVQAVQRAVESADALVQDWEMYSVEVNPVFRSLRVEIAVRLKEWREDTQVHLAVVQGADTRYPALTGGAGQYFGAVEISVNNQEVRLLARISAEGLQKEEDLFTWESASMLLPVQCNGWGIGGPDYTRDADKNGLLTVDSCEVELTGVGGRTDLPPLSGEVFRLRRNEDIAEEKAAAHGDGIDRYTCRELTAAAQIGDRMTLTFFCRDESGLGYEFFLNAWEIDENGIQNAGGPAPGADWPRLTWN